MSAVIEKDAEVGNGSQIWDLAQVRGHARIGEDCVLGRNVYIGPGVVVGNRTKIQNNALIYEPSQIGEGVFIGPGVILTNDHFPRAVTYEGRKKANEDWISEAVIVEEGASLGASAICVAPVRIGAWSVVAAGAVVTKDVAPYSLVKGNPARHSGWVGEAGIPLRGEAPLFFCPQTGKHYELVAGKIVPKER